MSENPDATIGAECFVPVDISRKPAVLAILDRAFSLDPLTQQPKKLID